MARGSCVVAFALHLTYLQAAHDLQRRGAAPAAPHSQLQLSIVAHLLKPDDVALVPLDVPQQLLLPQRQLRPPPRTAALGRRRLLQLRLPRQHKETCFGEASDTCTVCLTAPFEARLPAQALRRWCDWKLPV